MMSDTEDSHPFAHIVLLPSSGMGHLNPFLRLAASLTAHSVHITLITAHPTVSSAEAETLAQFSTFCPRVMHQQMLIPPITNNNSSEDLFTVQYEAIRRSSHLLSPLLSSLTPPVSSVITDMSLTSMVVPITKALNLPNYVLFTTCAKMLAIYAIYHKIAPQIEDRQEDCVILPGMQPIPKSWLPPPLVSPGDNLLKTHFKENGKKFLTVDGILVNTFEELEKESLAALNGGLIVDQLPPVIAIGPLMSADSALEKEDVLSWLKNQPPGSILYISFGTRAAMSKEQMQELGKGLVQSGCKFLWVVKRKSIDRDDTEGLEEILGYHVLEELKQRGVLVQKWVEQEEVLRHRAVGGFLSHCGWNSVTEAMWHGVPILAWPQNADQKINADLVEKNKCGKWDQSWGWGGLELIEAKCIAQRIKEMMDDQELRNQAGILSNKARTAVEHLGDSHRQFMELIKSRNYV